MSAESAPRPTDTQMLSASRDRQVDTESTQNSTRPERTVTGFPPTSARSSMLDVFAWRANGTGPRANWSHQGRSSCVAPVWFGTDVYADKIKKLIIFKRLLQKYVSDATAFDLSVTPDENVVIQLFSFSFKLKLSSFNK